MRTALFAIVFVGLVAIYASASPVELSKHCPKNEKWTSCGTACEPTCVKPFPKICTHQCVIGCQCKEGFLREKFSGKCVLPCDCPKISLLH